MKLSATIALGFILGSLFFGSILSGITAADCACSAPSGLISDNASEGMAVPNAIAYENHTISFRNNCSESVWIAANMGPNGPPFILNNVSQGRGCTGCSCSGAATDGWKDNLTCCPSINCTHQSCPNSSCSCGVDLPNGGGFEVPPGEPVNYTVKADPQYGGNAALFPRYGCSLSPDGVYLQCDTGTCYVQGTPGTPPEGIVRCGGVPPNGPPDQSPQLPTTKMEIFFAPTNWSQTDSDYYDVSLADGYNIPVQIEPVQGTYWTGGTAHNWCIRAGGTTDLLEKIQQPEYRNLSATMLVLRNNRPVALWSSCSYETQVNKTGPGQANATTTPGEGEPIWNLSCCKGACGTEKTCPIDTLPENHRTSQFFGTFYDHTYTYQYGDDQANIPCKGEKSTKQLTSYLITFCGGRILGSAYTHLVNVSPGIPATVHESTIGIDLTINGAEKRVHQRVTILTFEPDHPPRNFTHPLTPVGPYYEISSNIPDAEITGMEIRAHYQDTGTTIEKDSLRLFTYNGTWNPLSPGGIDNQNQTVWGLTNHTGVFAIAEYKPPKISDIGYTLPDEGDPLTIRLTATVLGADPHTYAWDVNSDGIDDYSAADPVHTFDQPGEYQVRLKVTDGHGFSMEQLATVVVSEYAIPLAPGWNFISIPRRLDPNRTSAGIAFKPVETTTRAILTYNASTAMWENSGAESIVIPQTGFWLNSQQATTLPLIFDKNPANVPPAIHLARGWNAIGLGDSEPLAASLALKAVEDTWTVLIPFNRTTQGYDTSILRGSDGIHSDARQMEPGIGYWLFMTKEGELPTTGA